MTPRKSAHARGPRQLAAPRWDSPLRGFAVRYLARTLLRSCCSLHDRKRACPVPSRMSSSRLRPKWATSRWRSTTSARRVRRSSRALADKNELQPAEPCAAPRDCCRGRSRSRRRAPRGPDSQALRDGVAARLRGPVPAGEGGDAAHGGAWRRLPSRHVGHGGSPRQRRAALALGRHGRQADAEPEPRARARPSGRARVPLHRGRAGRRPGHARQDARSGPVREAS